MGLNAIVCNSGYLLSPIKRHLSYVFQFDSEAEFLEVVVVQLKREKDRVAQSVDEATGNGEGISEDVKWWLVAVEKEIGEAEQLIQGKEEANKKSCVGVCPTLNSRYRLSKKVHKKVRCVCSLLWYVERIHQIAFRPPLEQIVGPSVFARDALSSRLEILDQIMNALKDPQLNVIGVYGPEGVGKTTLAKVVQAKAIQEKIFNNVVLVDVSQMPGVRRIQTDIADFLGMEFDEEDVPGRASQLRGRLKGLKVLIILKNLCHTLDLDALGIPSGNHLNSCKLLFTSSRMILLCNNMGIHKAFSLGILGEREAWDLFRALAPKSSDPQFQDIAAKISKQCAGLPLWINIATKDLQNKELQEWKNVLKMISKCKNEGLPAWKGMAKQQSMLRNKDTHQRVNDFLVTSSDNQHRGEMKSLLLLCSMFSQSNIEIQRLLMYCMGLALFNHTYTVREARNRLFTLIDKLKDESFLFDGDMDGCVKMEDVDQNAAMFIASTVHNVFVGTAQVQLDKLDRNCTKIILPYCYVSKLPSNLECPKADLFLLFTKDQGLKMPDSFFGGMRNLKVVDFTGMCFMSLPSSLSLLTNIQTLSLQKCQLDDVSFIGKLKQLQQLSFAYSRIVRLPEEIHELTQLKLLDLSNCTMLQVIPANVLSKLCQIEELYMVASFKRWGTKGNASLVELKNLENLTALEIQIENPKSIPGGLGFFDDLELKHFKFSVSKVDEASKMKKKVDEASHS